MNTIVVNLNKEEYDVYIGRPGKGKSGYFGNPHRDGSKERNIERFRRYFHKRLKEDREFVMRVRRLQGKRLGCFCAPRSCHGDIYVEYLNSLPEPVPIKVGVVGSRSFSDYEFLKEMLQWHDIKLIVSGGAKGADQLAEKYAAERGIPTRIRKPNWDKHGRGAGFIRNKEIVETSDEIIAFWDGKSRGTKHTIGLAEDAGKPVHVYKFEDDISIENLGL